MATNLTSPHPEQGQMVSVRSRNWMVTEVSASTLPPERLQAGLEPPQHLLTLSSVEDDGLGKELNVIWELEPGARVIEKVALPDPTGFDPPDRLDAFLLKRERPLRLFRELLPGPDEPAFPRKFDLLIVDEAHNCAPSGVGRYATDSLRTQALRLLVPHFEHKLFLTATPHNGYPESFSALLELLDNKRFARCTTPDRKQLNAVMVRRMKSELPAKWDGSPRFPKRVLDPIEVRHTDEERAVHAALRHYAESRISRARDNTEKMATEFVLKTLKKRLFSSPAAFLATLDRHEKSLRQSTRGKTVRQPSAGILKQKTKPKAKKRKKSADAANSGLTLFGEDPA